MAIKTLTKILGTGILALGLVGCGAKPVLEGNFDGKKYTLNYSSSFGNDSIVEEKIDGTNSATTKLELVWQENSLSKVSFLDYSKDYGFFRQTYNINSALGSVSVSNSSGMRFYSAGNNENSGIILEVANNLWNGINNVVSNKTAETERMRNETLRKLNGTKLEE